MDELTGRAKGLLQKVGITDRYAGRCKEPIAHPHVRHAEVLFYLTPTCYRRFSGLYSTDRLFTKMNDKLWDESLRITGLTVFDRHELTELRWKKTRFVYWGGECCWGKILKALRVQISVAGLGGEVRREG